MMLYRYHIKLSDIMLNLFQHPIRLVYTMQVSYVSVRCRNYPDNHRDGMTVNYLPLITHHSLLTK